MSGFGFEGNNYAHPASFRDHRNQIYELDSRIIRGLDEDAQKIWRELERQKFFQERIVAGNIIATRTLGITDIGVNLDKDGEDWASYLEHDRVPLSMDSPGGPAVSFI